MKKLLIIILSLVLTGCITADKPKIKDREFPQSTRETYGK